jgi:hypothetical protein
VIVVDRIEGETAVLEVDGILVEVPASSLPPGCAEGDTLELQRVASSSAEDDARLERLRDTTDQGPGDFEL